MKSAALKFALRWTVRAVLAAGALIAVALYFYPDRGAAWAWRLGFQKYAVDWATRCFEENPDSKPARLVIARNAWRRRNPQAARYVLGDLFPDQLAFDDLLKHGRALAGAVPIEDVVAYWEWLTESHPNESAAQVGLCSAYFMAGQDERVEEVAKRLVDAGSSHEPFGCLMLALVYHDTNRHLDANRMFRKASGKWQQIRRSAPTYDLLHARIKYAENCVRIGFYDDAVQQVNDVLKEHPHSVSALMLRGEAYRQLGRFEEAVADFRFVVEQAPTETLALLHLGLALNEMGNCQDALAPLREASRLTPNVAKIEYALGHALIRCGETREGREVLKRADTLRRGDGQDDVSHTPQLQIGERTTD